MLAAMSVVSEGSVHDGSNSLQAVASRSLLEMKGSFRTATHTKESVANGLVCRKLCYYIFWLNRPCGCRFTTGCSVHNMETINNS